MSRRSLVRVQPTATIVSIMTVFRIIAKGLEFLREGLVLDSLILVFYSEIGFQYSLIRVVSGFLHRLSVGFGRQNMVEQGRHGGERI